MDIGPSSNLWHGSIVLNVKDWFSSLELNNQAKKEPK